jgi:glutamine amidotransferase
VAVVDYGRGNIHSVCKALARIGCLPEVVGEPDLLGGHQAAVLPGVGAYGDAMRNLHASGMARAIADHVARGGALLGVCLGLQLLLDEGAEGGPVAGLGLLEGSVRRIRAPGLKVPHVGWNTVRLVAPSPLTSGLTDGTHFYFVHSYASFPARRGSWLAETAYGEPFASIAGQGKVFGVQFHPEKSGPAGLRLLANFVTSAGGVAKC